MNGTFLKLPFEGKGGRRLDSLYLIFGPTNVREHFPEDKVTLGKKKVEGGESCGVRMNRADWNKIVITMVWK